MSRTAQKITSKVWQCCNCGEGSMLVDTSRACHDCSHVRCASCKEIKYVYSPANIPIAVPPDNFHFRALPAAPARPSYFGAGSQNASTSLHDFYCPVSGCNRAEGSNQPFRRRDNLAVHVKNEHSMGGRGGTSTGVDIRNKRAAEESTSEVPHGSKPSREEPRTPESPQQLPDSDPSSPPCLSQVANHLRSPESSDTVTGESEFDNDPTPPRGSCCSACGGGKRWPQWVVWVAYLGCLIAAVSLYLLGWATSKELDGEQEPCQCPAPKPRLGDAGFLFALQNCGWHVSGLLAGLIPACLHAHRYRKWGTMKYAWFSALACLFSIIASVVVYVRSPAKSQGLAGLSQLPLGFFIFCATYEGLREEVGTRDENGFAMETWRNRRI